MDKITLLEEMDEALELANMCNEALEALLKEAKAVGRPSPELVEQISTTHKECDEAMERYVTAYRGFYNIPVS
jgi:hypothetical protein